MKYATQSFKFHFYVKKLFKKKKKLVCYIKNLKGKVKTKLILLAYIFFRGECGVVRSRNSFEYDITHKSLRTHNLQEPFIMQFT